jgi:hypothetical protein
MTQHQDLQLLRAIRTPEKQHQREQAPNREIDKRPDHPQTSASTTKPRLATANAAIRPARGENRLAPPFDLCYSRARVKQETQGLKEGAVRPRLFRCPNIRRRAERCARPAQEHHGPRGLKSPRSRRRPSLRTARAGCGVHKLGPGVDVPDLQADRVYEPYALRDRTDTKFYTVGHFASLSVCLRQPIRSTAC